MKVDVLYNITMVTIVGYLGTVLTSWYIMVKTVLLTVNCSPASKVLMVLLYAYKNTLSNINIIAL